jgi:hypothetical protein
MVSFKKLKSSPAIIIIGVLTLFDLWAVDKRYLDSDDYMTKPREGMVYEPTQADLEILKDKDPNYRVLNLSVSPFQDASTSYFHKSIGGYHGAKMKRYQELFDYQISKQNMKVLDMLNTKYIITSNEQTGPVPQRNPNALGNAWFVSKYKIVANADSELMSLTAFDPRREAIVDQRFQNHLTGLTNADSAGIISLTSYAPNYLKYKSQSSKEAIAVFSEIYYDKGWKAFIDGKAVDHFRANYVLRALRVPAGNHEIEFKFHPDFYYTGGTIALITSILLFLFFATAVFFELRTGGTEEVK